jgi:CRISPR/Cas system-associated protein Cas5 (RAMP superfamily)
LSSDALEGKEEFEDTKEVIRIRKSKKNRQYNGKKQTKTMIYKKTHRKKTKDRQYNRQKNPKSNDLQNTTQKTNDQAP